MKISELISDLEVLKEIHGDVECSIYADHGQSFEGVTFVQEEYIVSDLGGRITINSQDLEHYPPAEIEVVIYGQ